MPNDANFVAQMMTIGAVSSFDATQLSNSTLRSIASHIRTLKRNNITIDEKTLTINTVKTLDSLVDVHGKRLSEQYKRQIGLTIKRMYPKANILLNEYNNSRNRKSQPRMASEKFVSNVRKIRDEAVNILSNVQSNRTIEDLGQYDTCLAILLTIGTSLRIHEILQLTVAHIGKIEKQELINIKSKASNNVRFVALNDVLINTFATIQKQQPLVKENIVKKKLDHASKYQIDRFEFGYLIISSEDHMRKKLHEISASLNIQETILGFNIFRKHVTSVLTAGGGHFVAQAMNNHSSLNTTLDHYNVITPQAAQMTFDELVGKFNSLDPQDDDVNTRNPEIIASGDGFQIKNSTINKKNVKITPTVDYQTTPIDKFHVLDGLFDSRLNDIQKTINLNNSKYSIMPEQLDIESINNELAILTKIIQNEKLAIEKLNSDLRDQMLMAQKFNQDVNLTILANYKKRLDHIVADNNKIKNGIYTHIVRLKRDFDVRQQQQQQQQQGVNVPSTLLHEQNKQLSNNIALPSLSTMFSRTQTPSLQQQQQPIQQQYQPNQQELYNVYETPPYTSSDIILKPSDTFDKK